MLKTPPNEYLGPDLLKVFEAIELGMFGTDPELPLLLDSIRKNNDTYLVGHDFKSYCRAQEKVFYNKYSSIIFIINNYIYDIDKMY